MGVVATNQSAAAGTTKSTASKAPLATPRRQTLTGIKTSYKSPHYENVKCTYIGGLTPNTATAPRRIPGNLSAQRNAGRRSEATEITTDENAMVVARTPTSAGRARRLVATAAEATPSSSRRKSKRFMTIGYEGEVGRSPLMERQNIVVTVQRSKSAQTPIGKTTIVKRDVKQNEVKHNSLSAVCISYG